VAEAPFELAIALAQRGFGIDVELARQIGHHEQDVAHLVLQPGAVRLFAHFGAQFRHFLGQLGQHLFGVGPVETDPSGALLQLDGAGQGRQGDRHPVEHAGFGAGLALLGLVLLPGAGLGGGVLDLGVAENMGMAAYHLLGNGGGDGGKVEFVPFRRHLGIEHDLKQQIAQLILERGEIAGLDRFHHFIRLFQGMRSDGGEVLFEIPRAAIVPIAQAGHDIEQAIKGSGHGEIIAHGGPAWQGWGRGAGFMKGTNRLWRIVLIVLERPLRRNIRDSEPLQIVLCAPLGAVVGLLVVAMHEAVATLHWVNFGIRIDETLSAGLADIPVWRIAVVPACGGLLLGLIALLMHRYRPNEIIDPIEANALYGGRMPFIDSLRLAAQTVVSNGVGASLGMEAAFSQVGAAFLSVTGQKLRLRRADLRVFVGAGTAAAIAAAFNAPLAGSFYAFELVLGSYTPAALAQIAMASLAGTMVVRATIGTAPIFIVNAPVMIFHQWEYPFFVVIGIGASIVGIATMRTAVWCESVLRRISTREWLRPALGGALVSAVAMPFPHVLGSGHGAIQWLFDSVPLISYLALLLVAKIAATAISIGSGFRGGLFSASLLLGCLFGDVVARVVGELMPEYAGEHTVLMVVGMGAVAASIIGAPITMVLLALEVTGDFNVALAVLAGVVLAATITRFRFGYSFATWRFHQRGKPIRSGYDIGWLVDLKVGTIMNAEAHTVAQAMPLAKLRGVAPLGSAPILFAADAEGRYTGTIDLTVVHDPELDDAAAGLVARDLAVGRNAYLLPETDIRMALSRFEEFEAEFLPVLASEEDRKVIGFVSEAFALRRFAHEMERNHNAQLGDRDLFNIWPVK